MPTVAGADRRPREIGQDERDVPGARDHRMLAVGVALPAAARMHVHVGDDAQAAPLADVPQRAEVPAVETHDAGVERVRVEVVVEDEVDDPGAAVRAVAEQERAALPAAVRPRSRSPRDRRRHSNHEQESSCRGAHRRAIICAIEKFMDKLQVLIDAGGWPPDFRGHLVCASCRGR